MDLAAKIKSLLKGAEVYRTQGLLTEAREQYRSASKLIAAHPQIKNRDTLLQGLEAKLNSLEAEILKVENTPLTPEISAENQTLIKRLFSFGEAEDPENAALEGAIALIKFGQYNRAIEEFEALLDRDSIRFVAAKNILRCGLNTEDPETAVRQYGVWISDPRFDPEIMGKLKTFLENLLTKKGISAKLPDAGRAPTLGVTLIEVGEEEPEEDEVIDITAVSLQVEGKDKKKRRLEYEVSFQSGNLISILLSEREKEVYEVFRVGETIDSVELTSPMAIFKGTAKIMEKNQIKVGPRKGCFSVGLKITGI